MPLKEDDYPHKLEIELDVNKLDNDTLWRLLIGFKQQGSGSGGSGVGAHLMSGFSFVKLSQFLRHLHSQACTPVQVEAMKSRFHHVST